MGIHHIAITTRDLSATHAFYTDVMGFELVRVDAAPTPEAAYGDGNGWARHCFYDTGNGQCLAVWDLHDAEHLPTDFDLVVTAQQVRSYKPDPAHFTECARRIGTKKGWVHIAASYYHDVEPCLKAKIPVIWVNRNKEELDSGQKKPTVEVKSLLEAAKLLGAA